MLETIVLSNGRYNIENNNVGNNNARKWQMHSWK
jgi:hypothetical protein